MRSGKRRPVSARVRAAAVAISLLGAVTARAGARDAPVTAVVSASSSVASLARALDADADTRWCPDPRDARGELSVRFARPVTIKKVVVVAGRVGHQPDAATYHPPRLRVSLDQLVADVDPTENGMNPLELEALRGKEGQSFVLRLGSTGGARSDARDRCLSDLEIELADGTWVAGVSAEGATKLPLFVDDLTRALRSCDRAALAPLIQLPLPRRELEIGYAGAELHAATTRGARPAAAYATLGRVVKDCRALVFPADEDPPVEPRLQRPLGIGGFRVTGRAGGGVLYWDLTWRHERARWQLTRLSFTDFE